MLNPMVLKRYQFSFFAAKSKALVLSRNVGWEWLKAE